MSAPDSENIQWTRIGVGRLAYTYILGAIFGAGIAAFVAIEPTPYWVLILLAGLIGLGTDGILRSHPKANFRRFDDTTLFLFIPILATISTGLFLDELLSGYWTVPIGLVSAIPFTFVIQSIYRSADPTSSTHDYDKLHLSTAAYLIALFFYAIIHSYDIGHWASTVATGLVGILIGIELLKGNSATIQKTVIRAFVVGAIMAQAAWSMHFLPLTGLMAGTLLVLIFYLLTNVMDHHEEGQLNIRTGLEFMTVSALGILIISVTNILT